MLARCAAQVLVGYRCIGYWTSRDWMDEVWPAQRSAGSARLAGRSSLIYHPPTRCVLPAARSGASLVKSPSPAWAFLRYVCVPRGRTNVAGCQWCWMSKLSSIGKRAGATMAAPRSSRNIVLAVVQRYGWYLKHASAEMRADREVVMAAVKKDGYALQYASAELQADPEVVLAAMQPNRDSCHEEGLVRWRWRGAMYHCVLVPPPPLYFYRHSFEWSKMIKYPIWRLAGWIENSNGDNLKYASAALRANREFVLAAVQEVGALFALRHVSAELQTDPHVSHLLHIARQDPLDRPTILRRWAHHEDDWKKCYDERYAKISLARDRDALGAAVGVRTIPAPHAALNGAPEALPIVHCLLARRVRALHCVLPSAQC